jgi:hypothetical protein
MTVRGSGSPDAEVPAITAVDSVRDDGATTVVRAGRVELVVARVLGTPIEAEATLDGEIGSASAVLAGLRRTT